MSDSNSLPNIVQNAIDHKIQGIVSQALAWRQACGKAIVAGCPPDAVANMVASFESARSLETLAALSARFGEPLEGFFKKLVQRVDESSFSLEQWLSALEAVVVELGATSRVAEPSVMLGYVHCAAEFVATQRMSASLREVVEEMIEQYGFDG